jgi:CRP/FNR family transcriptional regulator
MSLASLSTAILAAAPVVVSRNQSSRCETCSARSLSVCAVVRPEDLKRLSAARASQHVAAGEVLLNEGDPATHFLNITEGAVKIYKLMPDGRRQITGFLFAGDLLGLAFNEIYTYSAEALTEVAVCRFPRRQFEQLLAAFPRMERRFLAMASNELAAAQEQMVLLGRKTAHERIASFLMMLVRREERHGRSGNVLYLPMTRTDIADYLGLTTETASRIFTDLKRRGFVKLESAGRVRVSDREALEELASGVE